MTGATGLGRVAPTAAALAFSSKLPGESGDPVVPTQLARVRLFRLPTEMPERAVLDTVVPFGDADDSRTMTFALTLTMVSERFGIELSLLDDQSQVIYQARDTVVAYTVGSAPPKFKPIVLRYAGPDTAVKRIAISPGETSLAIGDAVPLRVDAFLSSGAKTSAWVGFAVHGTTGITIDRLGTMRAVAPVAKGAAWVVARLATGLADSVAISAIVPAVKLTVSPMNGLTTVGGRLRLTSTAFDSTGAVLVGREPSWSSSDPTIATVADGVVSGNAPGIVQITARSERAVVMTSVTVGPKPVGRVTIEPGDASLLVGETIRAAAAVRDGDGVLQLQRTIAWSSLAPDVATVDGTGTVTARSTGVAKVVASVDGVADTMSVTVRRISKMTISHSASVPDPHVEPVITLVLRALDQAGAVIEGLSADWTIAGPADLMDRVGSSVRVTLHGTGSSVVTASAGGVEATIVIEGSDVLTTPTN